VRFVKTAYEPPDLQSQHTLEGFLVAGHDVDAEAASA
jgi:hypothetical protein